jgi:hypothetical protein
MKESNDYDDLYRKIVNKESEIILDTELDEKEKILILGAASTIRHSGYFWNTEQTVNWCGTGVDPSRWPCWSCLWNSAKKVMYNDAVGAIGGAVGGGLAGAAFGVAGGPAGSAAGFIGGATRGAVTVGFASSVRGAFH